MQDKNVQVRGVIAQQLKQVFPEHIQILDELEMKDQGVKLRDFHQVDKQALAIDGELTHANKTNIYTFCSHFLPLFCFVLFFVFVQ